MLGVALADLQMQYAITIAGFTRSTWPLRFDFRSSIRSKLELHLTCINFNPIGHHKEDCPVPLKPAAHGKYIRAIALRCGGGAGTGTGAGAATGGGAGAWFKYIRMFL